MRPLALPLLALLGLVGCTTANPGEPRAHARRFVSGPAHVYRTAAQVVAERRWSVTSADAAARVITVTAPGQAGRWPVDLTISVEAVGGGSRLNVLSAPLQGPSSAYVAEYLHAVGVRLGEPMWEGASDF